MWIHVIVYACAYEYVHACVYTSVPDRYKHLKLSGRLGGKRDRETQASKRKESTCSCVRASVHERASERASEQEGKEMSNKER